ncbi:plasmid mobilization relaxosome protein MobC, partial [Staphylococcus saprophyticus]|nr:plasmid mobilization relaxosome protein MobC [Staphylococcus saprophyticus]
HQHEAPNYEGLEHNIKAVRERLNDIWKNLN